MRKPKLKIRLTPKEQKIILRAAWSDGRIYRLAAGYWISPKTEIEKNGVKFRPVIPEGKTLEDVSASREMVKRLERRGFLVRTNEFWREYEDTRKLTVLGWTAAAQLTGQDPEYVIQARELKQGA